MALMYEMVFKCTIRRTNTFLQKYNFFCFFKYSYNIAHQIILCETKFRYVIDSNVFAIFIDS